MRVIFELRGHKSYYNVFMSAGLQEIIQRALGETPSYVYKLEKNVQEVLQASRIVGQKASKNHKR